jgi:dCTP deaminase
MILPYQEIKRRCLEYEMIVPWCERTRTEDGLTYGLGPAGYDIRLDQDISFYSLHSVSFKLASSMEQFWMPLDLLGQVCDKSTWARRGIFVQNTIIEPGWDGYLTLEITHNKGPQFEPFVIREGTPIAQIVFTQLTAHTEYPYEGKYQHQHKGIQEAL